jgi:hypothetical protein
MKTTPTLDPLALETTCGGAGGPYTTPPPQEQRWIDAGVGFMNQNFGGGWSSGTAHHQGIKLDTHFERGDSTPYKKVFANNGEHTAGVAVNTVTGAATRRLH